MWNSRRYNQLFLYIYFPSCRKSKEITKGFFFCYAFNYEMTDKTILYFLHFFFFFFSVLTILSNRKPHNRKERDWPCFADRTFFFFFINHCIIFSFDSSECFQFSFGHSYPKRQVWVRPRINDSCFLNSLTAQKTWAENADPRGNLSQQSLKTA